MPDITARQQTPVVITLIVTKLEKKEKADWIPLRGHGIAGSASELSLQRP